MWAQSELWAETGVQGQRPLPRLCMFMWLLPCFFACSLVRLYLLYGGMRVGMCLPVRLCVCVCVCACLGVLRACTTRHAQLFLGPKTNIHTWWPLLVASILFRQCGCRLLRAVYLDMRDSRWASLQARAVRLPGPRVPGGPWLDTMPTECPFIRVNLTPLGIANGASICRMREETAQRVIGGR